MAGSETVTWSDIASAISATTGETITFTSPSVADFTAALTDAGVPDGIVGLSVGFGQATKDGEFEGTHGALEKLLGHPLTTVQDYLASVYVGQRWKFD